MEKQRVKSVWPRNILEATPGAIEASERRGQAELAEADQLPREGIDEARAALEAMGVEILGPTEGDPLFVDVRLPPGWKKEGTGHAMGLYLVDSEGWKRASIFYKAAFYDRRASISLRRRYTYETRYSDDYTRIEGYVLDVRSPPKDKGDYHVIWMPEPLRYKTDREALDSGSRAMDATCRAWLDERLPEWRSPLAYWSDEPLPKVAEFPPWR